MTQSGVSRLTPPLPAPLPRSAWDRRLDGAAPPPVGRPGQKGAPLRRLPTNVDYSLGRQRRSESHAVALQNDEMAGQTCHQRRTEKSNQHSRDLVGAALVGQAQHQNSLRGLWRKTSNIREVEFPGDQCRCSFVCACGYAFVVGVTQADVPHMLDVWPNARSATNAERGMLASSRNFTRLGQAVDAAIPQRRERWRTQEPHGCPHR